MEPSSLRVPSRAQALTLTVTVPPVVSHVCFYSNQRQLPSFPGSLPFSFLEGWPDSVMKYHLESTQLQMESGGNGPAERLLRAWGMQLALYLELNGRRLGTLGLVPWGRQEQSGRLCRRDSLTIPSPHFFTIPSPHNVTTPGPV